MVSWWMRLAMADLRCWEQPNMLEHIRQVPDNRPFGNNRKILPGSKPGYKQPAMRSVTMRPEAHKRFTTRHPWVYSNEIVMDAAAKAIEPGSVVCLLRADG